MSALRVKTDFIYPPIPIRQFDWVAWFDNFGEEGPSAYGRTEAEAVQNLMADQGLTPDGNCIECNRNPETCGCPIGEDAQP